MKDLLIKTREALTIKEKAGIFNYIKMKDFCSSKHTIKSEKANHGVGKDICNKEKYKAHTQNI